MTLLNIREFLSSSRAWLVAAGATTLAFIVALFGWRVNRAENRGREAGQTAERDRVFRETVEQTDEIKESADETRRKHRYLDIAELRRRMRERATRRSDQ